MFDIHTIHTYHPFNTQPKKEPIPPDNRGDMWISDGGRWSEYPPMRINDETIIGNKKYKVKEIYVSESHTKNLYNPKIINPYIKDKNEHKYVFCWCFLLQEIRDK